MRNLRTAVAGTLVLASVVFLTATGLRSEPPAIPKISTFAPVADLLQQVDFFIARVETSLADPTDFDGAKQSRTLKDGHTLAVLALMLAVHDDEHPLKAAMPSLLKAAQALAGAGDDASRAKAALAEIQAARAGRALGDETVRWEKTASLSALMKQVPLIHAGLKRGVEPNRLTRQAVPSAGQSAALAAIAQASMLDTERVTRPEDVAAWLHDCAQMRDAAGEVNSAVHAQDQGRVTMGMQHLAQSCEACHAKFRDP
jgi:hypothetical protein